MRKYRFQLANEPEDAVVKEFGHEEAMRLFVSGTGQLRKEQAFAPLALMDTLMERAGSLSSLGPPTDVPKRMQRINENVFAAGIRQYVVDGRPLTWCKDKVELGRLAETHLSCCKSNPANLFEQVDAVYRHHVRNNGLLMRSFVEWSEQAQKNDNLVPVPHSGILFVGGDWGYLRVQPEWRRLYEALSKTQQKLSETLKQAFSEGRIICAQAAENGDRYIPPAAVDLRPTYGTQKGYSYLFSRDLPPDWFDDIDTLPKRRTAAKTWINGAGTHFADRGKRAASEDLKAIAQEKFGLSANAVQEIWVKCDFPNKGKKGAIPLEQRVSMKKIRGFE